MAASASSYLSDEMIDESTVSLNPIHLMVEKLSKVIQEKYHGSYPFEIVPATAKIDDPNTKSGSCEISCRICSAELEVSVRGRTMLSGTVLYSPKLIKLESHLKNSPRCSKAYHLHQAIINHYRTNGQLAYCESMFTVVNVDSSNPNQLLSSNDEDEIPAIKCGNCSQIISISMKVSAPGKYIWNISHFKRHKGISS